MRLVWVVSFLLVVGCQRPAAPDVPVLPQQNLNLVVVTNDSIVAREIAPQVALLQQTAAARSLRMAVYFPFDSLFQLDTGYSTVDFRTDSLRADIILVPHQKVSYIEQQESWLVRSLSTTAYVVASGNATTVLTKWGVVRGHYFALPEGGIHASDHVVATLGKDNVDAVHDRQLITAARDTRASVLYLSALLYGKQEADSVASTLQWQQRVNELNVFRPDQP